MLLGRVATLNMRGVDAFLLEAFFLETTPLGLREVEKNPSHPRIALFVRSNELLDGVNSLDAILQLLFGAVAWQAVRSTIAIVFPRLA